MISELTAGCRVGGSGVGDRARQHLAVGVEYSDVKAHLMSLREGFLNTEYFSAMTIFGQFSPYDVAFWKRNSTRKSSMND